MKTKLLLTLLLTLCVFFTYAQCPATLTGPNLEFSPAANTSLPNADISQPYSEVVEIFVPSRDKIGADSVDVIYYTITSFRGGPTGSWYSTTATGNLLTPGSKCITITNPNTPDAVGTYQTAILGNRAGINSLGDTVQQNFDTIVKFSLSTVYGTPRAEAYVNGSTSICEGDELIFSPLFDYSHASYTWSAAGATRIGSPSRIDTFSFPLAGTYNVILSASDVGTEYDTVTVSVTGYPATTISSLGFTAGCSGSAVLAYTPSGSFKVDAPQPTYNYQWYVDGTPVGGATDTTYTPLSTTGLVTVVTDNNGCVASSNSFNLTSSTLFNLELCMVTVDSATGKNILVWEKPSGASCLDSVEIWKESNVTDVYDLLATVDYNDFSTYIDASSTPEQKADKYRISLLDAGISSAQSDPHKTIHLTISLGQGSSRNLLWNNYEGAPVATYNIYRGTTPTNLTLYASVSGSNTSFTDLNPLVTTNIYQIELVLPYACNPSKTGQASTRSNIADDTDSSTGIDNADLLNGLTIAPNPTQGLVTISSENMGIDNMKMFSLEGRLVRNINNFEAGQAKTIDVSDLQPGLYVVSVQLENGSVLNKKLLVQ